MLAPDKKTRWILVGCLFSALALPAGRAFGELPQNQRVATEQHLAQLDEAATRHNAFFMRHQRHLTRLARKVMARTFMAMDQRQQQQSAGVRAQPAVTREGAAALYNAIKQANLGRLPEYSCNNRARMSAVIALQQNVEPVYVHVKPKTGDTFTVKTALHPAGEVAWRQHLVFAAIVADQGRQPEIMVIDPAFFDAPVSLTTFQKRIGDNTLITPYSEPQFFSRTDPQLMDKLKFHIFGVSLSRKLGKLREQFLEATTVAPRPSPLRK